MNLFEGVKSSLPDELIETLAEKGNVTVERIVSNGQATPVGEWCDQYWDEWVLLLTGSAALRIEGEEKQLVMRPGDHLMIPAHCRHRVEWTDQGEPTVWLVVHIGK